MKKKMMSLALALVMCMTLCVPAFATQISLSRNDMDRILLEMGFSESTLQAVSDTEAAEIVEAYQSDPESVQVSTSTMQVDVIEEVEKFVNATYDELLEFGLSQEEIARTTEILQQYCVMPDAELAEHLNLTVDQARYLKRIIDPNSAKKTLRSTVGASIPTADLSFTMVATNHSSSSQTNYAVNVFFAWQNTYSIVGFDDVVAVAWGGNLYQQTSKNQVSYFWKDYNGWQDTVEATAPAEYIEKQVNAGGYYEFSQNNAGNGYARMGSFNFTLTQNGRQGQLTKIIAQYGHKTLSVGGGVAVSASGPSVSLTVGSKYQSSHQISQPIQY